MIRNRLVWLGILGLQLHSGEAEILHDPTRPPFYHESLSHPALRQHVLSAIITNTTRRLARVDGQWLKEGQKIGDSRIVLIETNYVQLETPGGRISLVLPGESVRKPATASIMDRQGNRE
jgi:hypothetical protein